MREYDKRKPHGQRKPSKPYELKPTMNQTFEIAGRGEYDFAAALERSYRLQEENLIEEACETRYAAVRRIIEIIPDDDPIVLEWNHRNTRAALELLQASAVDHFLAGDFEMAAALCEMLLDLDPEDHTECVSMLGLCYVATEEYELFDEILNDIPDGMAEKHIALLWAAHRRNGTLPDDELRIMRERFGFCLEEFAAAEHPADEEYLAGLESTPPSKRALARRLWLRTEHLWALHPDFIAALRQA